MHIYLPDIQEIANPFLKEIEKIVEGSVRLNQTNESFHLRDIDGPIAKFILSQLHGCCGVCVSYHSEVYTKWRGKGLGTILNNLRIALAKAAKYGLLICTDVESNVAQNKILQKNGWTKAVQFTNPKTKHEVNLHYIKLD